MVVSEGAISNIMGGMENTAGVRLHSHRHKLKQRFDIIKKLGQGTYGKVQLAVNKETGQEVAIKTIKKAKIETEQDLVRIRREIQIMSSVQHPQIIHIFEVFENREKMVLVMEYAAGGELYDYLSERKVLTVEEARRVFRQVASAVYYCHKHKICHRDLKLENILLDIDGNAKIADFGLSNVFEEKRRLDTFCGSPLYASPEIVKGIPYVGPEVDCWSLGVLLYTLVYGAMPFDGSNFKRLVKQITQGDFYEPPTPSSASPLVRSMLTVTAEKRATIADICSHWWVNDGESKSCLDEAEALANQTPVRLDLLLSLAPKHISSEHMVIQPDEEDSSQRSEDGQSSAAANLHLPPPPPVPPPATTGPPQTRSLSTGALHSTAAGVRDSDLISAPVRRDEDKRRREAETPAETKKRKETTPTSAAKVEEDKRKTKKKSVVRDEEPITEKKRSSVKKKEVLKEGSPMDVEEQVEAKPKSVRKKEPVSSGVEIDDTERQERKKSVKKKEPVAVKDSEKKRVVRKKESSVEKSVTPSRDSTPKASSPPFTSANIVHRASKASDPDELSIDLKSPSNKSIISGISTDGTLKASDSSLSTRQSTSPAKSVIEVDRSTSTVATKIATKQPVSSATADTKTTKTKAVDTKTTSAAKVGKVSSMSKVSKNSSAAKIDTPVVNGSGADIVMPDTEEVLKKTASKIKNDDSQRDVNDSTKDVPETTTSKAKRKTSADSPADSNSKENSQHSSVVSTPARSRTGSESSSDTKPGSSRRGSKLFSKAAMWDNLCQQQQSEKPPPSVDKGRKAPRPGGLNMTDLTKKFEEKPVLERKKPVVGSVKISDVKRSFENKSSEKVGGFRRPSMDGSGDSINSRREGSLPVSPTRPTKKEDSLPPPGKTVRKTSEVSITKDKDTTIQKQSASASSTPDKPKAKSPTKEKSPPKPSTVTRTTVSPTKDTSKKEKSPSKEPISTRPGTKRDVTTPRRTSPIKDKSKPVTIAIKKVGSTSGPSKASSAGRDVCTPDVEKQPKSVHKKTSSQSVSTKYESSESSDSESEAERLLRQVSERRERVEAAKQEKLRKVSQQKDDEVKKISRPCNENQRSDDRSGLPPLETPSDTPDDILPPVKPVAIPQASMKDAEQPSSKYSSLPRGFRSKAAERQDVDEHRRKKSEVEITLSPRGTTPSDSSGALSSKRASYAEIQLAAPHHRAEMRQGGAGSRSTPTPGSTPPTDPSSLQRAPRERIIPIMMEGDDHRSSSAPYPDPPSGGGRSSNTPSRGSSIGPPSESPFIHSPLFKTRGSLIGGVFGPPSGGAPSLSRGSSSSMAFDQRQGLVTASPEPIRKSRRERIIPISVEGQEDTGASSTSPPPPHLLTSTTLQNTTPRSSGGRVLPIERPDSISSNDEDDEEEDEDDGFQILTAESLFSTLLNRVRNLTRKMSIEESAKNARRMMVPPLHQQMGFHHSPFSSGGSSLHGSGMMPLHHHTPFRSSLSQDNSNSFSSDHGGPQSGFWSSLYSPPREMSRQQSEASSVDGGQGRPSLSRELSRDSTASSTVYQGATDGYNTLPRGWRARQEASSENLRQQSSSSVAGVDEDNSTRKAPDKSREKSQTPSGEANGRVGGIIEQPSKAVQLASPSRRITAFVGLKSPSDQLNDAKTSISNTINKNRSLSQQKQTGFSSAKNVPSTVSAFGAPKRSSSASLTSGQSEAKHQLQRLVEELETSDDPLPSPTSTQSKTVSPTSIQVSCSIQVKPNLSQSSSLGGNMGAPLVGSSKIMNNVTPKSHSSSKIQIPEPVSNIQFINSNSNSAIATNNLLQACTSTSRNYSVPTTSNFTQRSQADIPLTVEAISAMTQSLPADQASTVLSNSCNPLYSSTHTTNTFTEKLPVSSQKSKTVSLTSNIPNNVSTSITQKTSGNSDLIPSSSAVTLRTTSSGLRGSRGSLYVDPHKKLFPWETTATTPTTTTANTPLAVLGRQKSAFAATPYRRGKSEDLRSAIDTIGRIDSSFERYKKAAEAAASTTSDSIKPYRSSRSRELNPTIEAASEKLNQLNSSNVKKISPFEAYRRSKSRELGPVIDQVQSSSSMAVSSVGVTSDRKPRLTSPPPPGLPQSPTSKARLMSPPPTNQTSTFATSLPLTQANGVPSFTQNVSRPTSPEEQQIQLEQSSRISSKANTEVSRALSQAPTPSAVVSNTQNTFQRAKTPFERAKSKLERKIERAKSPTVFIEHGKLQSSDSADIATKNMIQNEMNSGVVFDTNEIDKTKPQERVKKTSTEGDKPKSVYKMITSKFSKSTTNVSDDVPEVTDNSEDKFKLKRPSRFIKGKPEKSPSQTSINEEAKEEHTEKKTNKFSDAFNKILGRKIEETQKPNIALNKHIEQIPSATTSPFAKSEKDISKRPARYRGAYSKPFSKSHENLNKYTDSELVTGSRASSVAPDHVTVENVTKSICDHLSKLESDISTRISAIDSSSDLRLAKSIDETEMNRPVGETVSTSVLTSQGYTPVYSQKVSKGEPDSGKKLYLSAKSSNTEAQAPLASFQNGEVVKVNDRIRQKSEVAESVRSAPEDSRCFSPTSWCGESVTSAPEDLQAGLSDDEESVMDRITRKSFYSRFQDGGKKRRSKISQPTTKFEEDQQLAAAKARLMEDERRQRESLSPLRATSPNTRVCISRPDWEATAATRRAARSSVSRSMPFDNYAVDTLQVTMPNYRDISSDRNTSSAMSSGVSSGAYRASSYIRGYSIEPQSKIGIPSSTISSPPPADASRLKSPSPPPPPWIPQSSQEAVVSSARDELSKHLTTLTRGASSSSGTTSSGVRPYRRTTTTGTLDILRDKDSSMPPGLSASSTSSSSRPTVAYRRTTTTGTVELPSATSSASSSTTSASTLPRLPYRRTNTMDLPSTADISRPSDYRRFLQPVNRRYSTASKTEPNPMSSTISSTPSASDTSPYQPASPPVARSRRLISNTLSADTATRTAVSTYNIGSSPFSSSTSPSSSSYVPSYSNRPVQSRVSSVLSGYSSLPRRTSLYRY